MILLTEVKGCLTNSGHTTAEKLFQSTKLCCQNNRGIRGSRLEHGASAWAWTWGVDLLAVTHSGL